MTASLSIGAAAREAGIPTSTVRYYERAGLVRPRGRSSSNYRLYSEEDVQMKELRHVQKVLRASLMECKAHQASGRCKVVDQLSTRAKRR